VRRRSDDYYDLPERDAPGRLSRILADAKRSLAGSEIDRFVESISGFLTPQTPFREYQRLLIALRAILSRPPVAVCFVARGLANKLPIADERLLDDSLGVLLVLFQTAPSCFQDSFTRRMEQLIINFPERSVILLSYCAQHFADLANPFAMLDFLFASSKHFFKAKVGSALISILFYLCSSHADFRSDRMAQCQQTFCEGLRAKDEATIQITYNTLYVYYEPKIPLDLTALANHLRNPKVADFALTFLLKHRHVPANAAVISALVSAASSNDKASLVLMNAARRAEYAALLVADSKWIGLPLPKIKRTLQLFFVVFGHEQLRAAVEKCSEIPTLFCELCRKPKVLYLTAIAVIVQHMTMTTQFFALFVKSRALEFFLKAANALDNEAAMKAGLEVLIMIGDIDFAREYLILADKMKSQLRLQTETSTLCVSAITILSQHPLCAQKFVELDLEPYFQDLQKIKLYRAEATAFLKNVAGIRDFLIDTS
jgi:hypothetical protein